VIFAEHQQRGYSPDAIRIVQGFTGGPTLAADTMVVVNPCGGEEIEDLRALRISRRRHEQRDLSDFFPLSNRSSRVTISTSPPCRRLSTLASSGRSVRTPLSFSAYTLAQPAL